MLFLGMKSQTSWRPNNSIAKYKLNYKNCFLNCMNPQYYLTNKNSTAIFLIILWLNLVHKIKTFKSFHYACMHMYIAIYSTVTETILNEWTAGCLASLGYCIGHAGHKTA